MMQRTKAASLDTEITKQVADSRVTPWCFRIARPRRSQTRQCIDPAQHHQGDRRRSLYLAAHPGRNQAVRSRRFTWLRTLTFTGTPQGTNPAAAYRPPPPDTTKKKKKAVVIELPRDTVRIRLVGRTVDLQAFTRFYRSLEESPFLGGVQFSKTETMVEDGKEIRQFTLDVLYTRPDSTLLKRCAAEPTAEVTHGHRAA